MKNLALSVANQLHRSARALRKIASRLRRLAWAIRWWGIAAATYLAIGVAYLSGFHHATPLGLLYLLLAACYLFGHWGGPRPRGGEDRPRHDIDSGAIRRPNTAAMDKVWGDAG